MFSRRHGCWLLCLVLGCQDYVFEPRPPRRVLGKKIGELVETIVPADILLVVDNSGTMQGEISELRRNVGLFITELSQGDFDFQIGLITTDAECNLPAPAKDCSPTGTTSSSCCNLNPTVCQDRDTNLDSVIDSSDCDGGRLRAAPSTNRRIFRRPSEAERQSWVAEFDQILAGLGTAGSSYESGLEATLRALRCAKGQGCSPQDAAVAALNQGFLRDEADLVIIFVTDEDDCSVADRTVYERPGNASDPLDQEAHFCWPDECYAHWSGGADADVDGLSDWSDPDYLPGAVAGTGLFACGPTKAVARAVDPPALTSIDAYLDALVALKGGDVRRIRAAGIVSGVSAPAAPLEFAARACVPSEIELVRGDCGCLETSRPSGTHPPSTNLWCELTELLGQRSVGTEGFWCEAMPSGRYVTFLEALAARRQAAAARSDTLVASICQEDYSDTLYTIVNNIILTSCFDLGETPSSVDRIVVRRNGELLDNVPVNGEESGWSWVETSPEICLEGGLRKVIGDEYEIFILQSGTTP